MLVLFFPATDKQITLSLQPYTVKAGCSPQVLFNLMPFSEIFAREYNILLSNLSAVNRQEIIWWIFSFVMLCSSSVIKFYSFFLL